MNFGKDIAVAEISGKTYVTSLSGKGHFHLQNTTANSRYEADRYMGIDTYMFNSHEKAMQVIELAKAKGLEVVER